MSRYKTFTLLPFTLATIGLSAHAAIHQEGNDALAISNARVSMVQAIATAENHVHGKAAKAEFEHVRQHGWVYDVEVVRGASVYDVKVDPQNGTVIGLAEDKVDHDDAEDEQD